LLSLVIQAIGGFLIVFFLLFLNHQGFTTWSPYVVATSQMLVLIVMILIFELKKSRTHSTEEAPLLSASAINT
jgi:hypothetical protein